MEGRSNTGLETQKYWMSLFNLFVFAFCTATTTKQFYFQNKMALVFKTLYQKEHIDKEYFCVRFDLMKVFNIYSNKILKKSECIETVICFQFFTPVHCFLVHYWQCFPLETLKLEESIIAKMFSSFLFLSKLSFSNLSFFPLF